MPTSEAHGRPNCFLAERGFTLGFSTHTDDEITAIYLRPGGVSGTRLRQMLKRGEIGPVFANLRARSGVALRAYGTGSTEEEAAQRAADRWITEQGE